LDNWLKSVQSKNAFAHTLGPDPEDQSPHPESTAQGDMHLRLLATSDLHMNILPYDYYTGSATDRLGLARTASLIAAARAEVENCLLFDNGDFLQGSPMGDYIAQSRGMAFGDMHPMITAMNHLRYDAGTLGNHEFNYGLEFLKNSLNGAEFPIVAANIYLSDGQLTFVPPYVILNRTVADGLGTRHPIKIGVVGFTPPQILVWDNRHLAGKLITQDIVDAATAYVPQMLRDGADIIVALSHSGIGSAEATPGMENASTALAQIDGIDAVIAGHSHLVFPSADFAATNTIDPAHGTLCGKPAVMPGLFGSHLGVIDLVLKHSAGKYQVLRHTSAVRPIWHQDAGDHGIAHAKTDAELAQLTLPVHLETLAWANRTVGHTDTALHSYFALITDAPALQLVAAAQAKHIKHQLATTEFAHLPVLASVAPFKAGGRGGSENYTDVPAGDVMLRHAADLYIHPNTSAAIRLTGAEIADWLEFAVGIFNHIPPGSNDAPLINPDFPSFNFDVIFGLGFQIDLTQPPRYDVRGHLINPQSHRILALTYQDAPLDHMANFAVATNSYRVAANRDRLSGGDTRLIYQSTQSNLDLVLNYFAAGNTNLPTKQPNRHFMPVPNTTVCFETSPKALDHMADLHNLNIEPIGLMPNGFLRFRLHL
jgi:2',3'-cyclic-nucleotide 2'-phosphodiesterase / 3'-nucleotidase